LNLSFATRANGFQSNTANGFATIEQVPAASASRFCGGFTLLELMIVLAVLAILLTIAAPAYDGFVTRAKLRSGTSDLSSYRGVLEQYYQDSRDYRDEGDAAVCGISTYTSDHFTLTCGDVTRTTYTLTATSVAGVGTSSAGDYIYTINQDGVRSTTRYKGAAVAIDDWKYR
jgi:prepilin-type N-terminal cleavage/methylation domain-containing protein